jgi:phosphoglycerate dehydrogenase-like enzyme
MITPRRLKAALRSRAGFPVEAVTVRDLSDVPSGRNEAVIFATGHVEIARIAPALPGLRWVQVTSAGVDDLIADWPKGVMLTNASGVHAEKAAGFVLMAALMLAYRMPRFIADQADRRWLPVYGGSPDGRRVTMLGGGSIGTAAAAALAREGFKVTGVTRTGRSSAALACLPVSAIDRLLPDTDVLVSTLPLTAETRGLIDHRRLALMPRGAGVIVVGRAEVVDYSAMAQLLADGHLGGAVVDVYPVEPLPKSSPLWASPGLVMTPHCSLDDHSVYLERCLAIFIDNLDRFLAGQPLRNAVDLAHGY